MPCADFAKKKSNLLWLHNVAEAYGQRPSAIMGIEDEIAAFNLDAAALYAARSETAKQLAEIKANRQGNNEQEEVGDRKYASFTDLLTRAS